MTLIDRYLNAIRWQLPEAKRDDIVEELRDTLLSSVEEKEAALGRRLSEAETEDLLHAFGHPMRVAARYRTRQHLIGPEVLPLFEFGVRAAAVIVLVLGAVTLLLGLLGGDPVGRAVTQAMARVWNDGVYALGVLTFVALVLEYSGVKLWTGKWKLRELPSSPPPPRRKRKGVFEGVFEIAFGVLAILWWTSVVPFPNEWLQSRWSGDVRLEPAPIWAQLYWPILGLLVLGLLQNVLDLLARGHPRVRGVGLVLTASAGAYVVSRLLEADRWAVVTSGAPELADALNQALRIGWLACLAVCAFQILHGIWLLIRGRDGC